MREQKPEERLKELLRSRSKEESSRSSIGGGP